MGMMITQHGHNNPTHNAYKNTVPIIYGRASHAAKYGKSMKMDPSQLLRGHLTSSSPKTREAFAGVCSWGESKYLESKLNPSFFVIPCVFHSAMGEFQ